MLLRTLQRAAFIMLAGAGAAMVYACADQAGDSVTSPATPTVLPDLRLAIAAQGRNTDKLLAIPGVVGTAVTVLTDGRAGVQVLLEHAGVAGVPAGLDGVPVVTEVTGRFMAFSDPRTRQRPAPLGFSVGHPSVTAGTIGARVRDALGRVYILSNNHVLANSNSSTVGDPAYQPGPFDGGTAGDQIATLSDFQTISFGSNANNTMDAAIALSTAAALDNSTPLDDAYGLPSSIIYGDGNGDGQFDDRNALLGLAVQKYGRTTRLTHGTITGVNATVVICYEVSGIFCTKSARFVDQLIISPAGFSDGGDSGSLIVTDDEHKNPVALLFAGSATQTIGNRIDLVLNRFGVTIDGFVPGPFTDVSVTSLSAPVAVVVDSTTTVSVTVRNLGNQDVVDSFDVTLQDSTEGITVGTQSVPGLAVGATATLTFDWVPHTSASHRLIARQSLSDGRPANDENVATVSVGPPLSDVAVTAMSAPSAVAEGQTITVGVTVGNVGNLPAGSFVVTLRDTTSNTIIGSQAVTGLAVGGGATVSFSWNTTGVTLGSHVLAASHDLADDNAANNQNVRAVTVNPRLTDIALTSFTGPASVRQGDTAHFSVTVRNVGEQTITTPFDVVVTDGTAGGVTVGTGTVNGLAIGASATLDIAWNTAGAAITGHTLFATQMLPDGNATNNSRAIGITIQPPITLVPDVSITALNAPASASQGTTAGVTVTVQNVGQQSVGTSFTVTLTDSTSGVTIGTQTVSSLAVGAATTLTFSWNTTGAALGTHTLVATHGFIDAVPSNNRRTTLSVITAQVIDIALTAFTGPSSVNQGDTAHYLVTIQNTGGVAVTAGIPVQLRNASAGVTIGTQTIPGLAAGAIVTLDFAWNTAGVAVTGHTLMATQMLPDNNATNNARAIGILIKPPVTPLLDLAVTAMNAAPTAVLAGQSVNVSATLGNAGNQIVGGFVVTLQDATSGATIGTQTVGGLGLGATTNVAFTWNTTGAAPGAHSLVISHNLTDGNAANNQRSATVTVNATVLDLAVSALTGPGPVTQGTPATINVTVQNVGQLPATTPFDVVLTDATAGVTIGTQTVNSLAVSTSAAVSFSWNTTGASIGNHTLVASHTQADVNASNNQRSATFSITPPIVDVALAGLSGPAALTQGDTGRYIVTVQNVGGQNVAASFDAVLTDATTGLVIGTQTVPGLAPGTSVAIEFAWNTAGVSAVGHTLTARHTLADNNATNNSRAVGVVINPPSVHVGNLTGSAVSNGSTWSASVEITVHDHAHRLVSGVTVRGGWGGPNVGECVTSETGTCTVVLTLPNTTGLVSFGMTTMIAGGYVYKSVANHDPDGSSNGSTIFVRRP